MHISPKLIDNGLNWWIYMSTDARTAHPFNSGPTKGGFNHPAIDLVLSPGRVEEIPEVQFFPTLGKILTVANAPFSLLRTTACDAKLLEISDTSKNGGYSKVAGAWVQLAYRIEWHNQKSEKLLSLARMIQSEIAMPNVPFSVRYTVSPYRSWYGRENAGFYGLALELAGKGHDARSAWAAATEGCEIVAVAISKVGISDALLYME